MHDDDWWPETWDESQEHMERPRMRHESASDYAARRAVAKLSAQIRASLQVERDRMTLTDDRAA